ncbi:MAG: SCO family protein [Capsulimonadales bacterium]|nr:SCO family protein [Capsulimonadales bacterium]
MNTHPTRFVRGAIVCATTLYGIFFAAVGAHAQRPVGLGTVGNNRPINAARDISWTQRLDHQVTLATPFRNENGQVEPLSTYFGKRPVVLVMPFYKCPGICTQELNGMVDAFKDPQIRFRVGRDFDVVTISINPKETPELATAKKKEYLDILDQPGAENGWHFLTGEEANIKKVADEIGFKYTYDAKTDQYAHPGGIVVLTPQGKVSRYFFGVGFSPRDVRFAVTEAGQGRIGTAVDNFLLACYHYDPQTGTYGPAVFRIMQVLGISTVAILGSFIFLSIRQEQRQAKPSATGGNPPAGPAK